MRVQFFAVGTHEVVLDGKLVGYLMPYLQGYELRDKQLEIIGCFQSLEAAKSWATKYFQGEENV